MLDEARPIPRAWTGTRRLVLALIVLVITALLITITVVAVRSEPVCPSVPTQGAAYIDCTPSQADP